MAIECPRNYVYKSAAGGTFGLYTAGQTGITFTIGSDILLWTFPDTNSGMLFVPGKKTLTPQITILRFVDLLQPAHNYYFKNASMNWKTILLCILLIPGVGLSQDNRNADTSWFYDTHFHLTNYVQEGIDIHKFIEIMGNAVGRSTLFGIPLQQQ